MSDYVIPILTDKSITQQWVHQEIGYATARNIPIIPIVEADIRSSLTALVNNSLELPYQFKRMKSNSTRENEIFRNNFLELLLDLNNKNRGIKKKTQTRISGKPITQIEYKTWGRLIYNKYRST